MENNIHKFAETCVYENRSRKDTKVAVIRHNFETAQFKWELRVIGFYWPSEYFQTKKAAIKRAKEFADVCDNYNV